MGSFALCSVHSGKVPFDTAFISMLFTKLNVHHCTCFGPFVGYQVCYGNTLCYRSPTLVWQRATLVTVGCFAGRRWTNSKKWYT